MLEPPVFLACLASVVRHNKNSILSLLYNLVSKTHPLYPILLGNFFHILVFQRMHKLIVVGHVWFGQLRPLEPSSHCFHLLKERAHAELILMKMTGPV